MSSFMVVGDIDLPIVIEFIGGSHFFVLIEVRFYVLKSF